MPSNLLSSTIHIQKNNITRFTLKQIHLKEKFSFLKTVGSENYLVKARSVPCFVAFQHHSQLFLLSVE